MAEKKNTSPRPASPKEGTSQSPQRELLEKARRKPGLGRKPAGEDAKGKSAPKKGTKGS